MWVDLAWLLGVLTLGLLSPGPDFLLVVKNSLGANRRRAGGTVLGIGAGLTVQVTVISLGFASVSPDVLRWIQLGGAAFLAWLGFRALFAVNNQNAAMDAVEGTPHQRGARSGFLEGLICNLTNPKAFVFFVSLFAQVLREGSSTAWRILLPVTVVVHGIVSWSAVSLALQSPPVARRLRRAQRWLPRAFGAVLIAVAVWVVIGAGLRESKVEGQRSKVEGHRSESFSIRPILPA